MFALSPDEHVLLLVLHHIAGDGWSLSVLGRDLGRLYAARRNGGAAELPALRFTMPTTRCGSISFSAPRRIAPARLRASSPTGRETLRDLPEQLDLPYDRARPSVASYRGDVVPLALNAALHRGLLALSRESGASLFMVLQAGLAALLTRLGAGTDIPIGSPIAGRTDGALDELIGFFVNTLVLRTDTSGNPSFRDLVGRVRAGNLAAYGHQDVPFERLVEVLNPARSLSRHPLFQVMLALQNAGAIDLDLAGLTARPRAGRDGEREVRSLGQPGRAARRGRRTGRDRGCGRICDRPVRSVEHRGSGAALRPLPGSCRRPARAGDRQSRHSGGRRARSASCASGTRRRASLRLPRCPRCLPRRRRARRRQPRWCSATSG